MSDDTPSSHQRRKISMPAREAVARRAGVVMDGEPHLVPCHYCGMLRPVTWHPPGTYPWRAGQNRPRAWVVAHLDFDHVLPVSRGGASDSTNLVFACVPCNTSKGDRTVDEWIERLRRPRWSTLERRELILERFGF